MRNIKIPKFIGYIGFFISSGIIVIFLVNVYVLSFTQRGYYNEVSKLPQGNIGLVLGASVKQNGEPSDILKDRLKVAFNAYKQNKIQKIIVSGDNSTRRYNEPVAMQKYLINMGVQEDDIYLDYAGFDTYDSLYRAQYIFGVKHITLFTQDFHLKRALYISKRLGIRSQGVATNLQPYLLENYNNRREVFARIKAFLEVEILKNKPRYLGEKVEIISDEKIEEAKKEILDKN